MDSLLPNFFQQNKASTSGEMEDATWFEDAFKCAPSDPVQLGGAQTDEHKTTSTPTNEPHHTILDEYSDPSGLQSPRKAIKVLGETDHQLALETGAVEDFASSQQAQQTIDLSQPAQDRQPLDLCEPTSVDPTQHSLVKYRPTKDIPPFRGRHCKTPPPAESSWMIPMDWPPPKPSPRTRVLEAAIVPPDGSPFHLHVQAYALRWGTWASSIEDYNRREQVLKFVTREMRKAWETAIKEGYYIKPNIAVDEPSDDPGARSKKLRKKAVSPSREVAPFAVEGKAVAPITNKELEATGITMEMINARVAKHELQEGEHLLEAMKAEKGRELVKFDWTKHVYGNPSSGRDLFIYCLYTAQECRKDIAKLKNLLGHFTRESQRKNTHVRIATEIERAEQHLALAIELHHQKQDRQELVRESEPSTEEGSPESSSDEQDLTVTDVEEETIDCARNIATFQAAEQALVTLAREICNIAPPARAQQLLGIFAAKGLTLKHFDAEAGFQVGDQQFDHIKSTLGHLYENGMKIHHLHQSLHRASDQPVELMRLRKNIELHEYRLFKEHSNLLALFHGSHEKNTIEAQGKPVAAATPQSSVSNEILPEQHDLMLSELANAGTALNPHNSPGSAFVEHKDAYDTRPPTIQKTDSNGKYDTRPPAAGRSTTGAQWDRAVVHASNTDASMILNAHTSAEQAKEVTSGASISPTIRSATPLISPTNTMTALGTVQQSTVVTKNAADQSVSLLHRASPAIIKSYIDQVWIPWLQRYECQLPQEQIIDWPRIEKVLLQKGLKPHLIQQTYIAFHDEFPKWLQKQSLPKPSRPASMDAMPTDEEIKREIPSTGISPGNLLFLFQHRLGANKVPNFHNAVRRLVNYDRDTGLLFVKDPASIAPHMLVNGPQATHNATSTSPYTAPPPYNSTARPTSAYVTAPPPGTQPIKLKLLLPKQPGPPTDEYSPTQINSTSGFSFRHLPSSSLAQRKRAEENIEQYVARIRRSRKKPWGEYIVFSDPESRPEVTVAHGVWNTKDGEQPTGYEWFFEGGEKPAGFSGVKRPGEEEVRKRKRVKKTEAEEDAEWVPY